MNSLLNLLLIISQLTSVSIVILFSFYFSKILVENFVKPIVEYTLKEYIYHKQMQDLTPKLGAMPTNNNLKTMVLVEGFGHRLISQQFPHGTIDPNIFSGEIASDEF